MPFDYVYYGSDFPNATILDIGDIQDTVTALNLTSATLLYINGGNDGNDDVVQMIFSNELSTGEKTIVDIMVTDYTDPILLNDTICKVLDIKSPGTNGGSFAKDTWVTRVLNTLEGDVSFATLSNNQITLEPGNYIINIKAPACDVESHQMRLRNITDSEFMLGNSAFSSNGQPSISELREHFVLNNTTVFDIQHICSKTNNTSIAMGRGVGFATNEIYTTVFIQKI